MLPKGCFTVEVWLCAEKYAVGLKMAKETLVRAMDGPFCCLSAGMGGQWVTYLSPRKGLKNRSISL